MISIIDFLNNLPISEWYVGKPLKAFLLIISSFILAKIFDWIVSKFLNRLTQKTATQIDDKLIAILHRPVFYSILFIGLNLSIEILEASDRILYISC